MGKDREGVFHPKKGKPSGSPKTDAVKGVKNINSESIEEYYEIADKYTVGEEEPAPNLHVRHKNRNVDKGEERVNDKKDNNSKSNSSNKSLTETFSTERVAVEVEELSAHMNKEQFAKLASVTSDCCISIYLATEPSGVEKNEQKDTIAFKNNLQLVTSQLRERGFDMGKIEALLHPAYELLRNEQFWLSQNKGLAVFISEGELKYIRMPITPKDETIINSTYYMAPLIPIFTSHEYFYILVLSKKQTKIYRADQFGINYIPVPELPNGVDDVVRFEEREDQKLFRTDTSGAGEGANYHGMGGGKPDEKQNIAAYFDEVDETLWAALLKTETAPMILAGVEYLLPIYKSVAEYKHIVEDVLTGSHEHEDMHQLHQQALAKMQPIFEQRTKKALDVYGNHSATELTSSIPADVIPAAHYGRVSHLFIQKNEHIWGKFDEMKNELVIHETQEEGDECLVDKTALKTLLTGGEVHVLDKEQMPGQSIIAAVLRY